MRINLKLDEVFVPIELTVRISTKDEFEELFAELSKISDFMIAKEMLAALTLERDRRDRQNIKPNMYLNTAKKVVGGK